MMNRLLVVAVLAVTLIRPAAAGTLVLGPDETAASRSLLDAVGERGMRAAGDFWMRTHTVVSKMGIPPTSTGHALLAEGPHNLATCRQARALAPSTTAAGCPGACDAAKEACDRQCDAKRTTCMSQCPVVGFACDPMCQAAYLLCKGNCGRARDTCMSNCRGSTGDKN